MQNNRLYHQALICEYGHLITGDRSAFVGSPASYCPRCGQACISVCPSCGEPIHGDCYECQPVYGLCCTAPSRDDFSVNFARLPEGISETLVEPCSVPAYCHVCGSPYPWTETLFREAGRIVDLMDELTAEQKATLKDCFPSMISDMPTTPANSLIAVKLLQPVSVIAKTALQNLLVDHVTALVLSLLGWKS